ncbi:peptide chain release factor N(5)-glutamine methyltransferase [Protofrankia sp. BMG5.30]|uniref:peptide chain release factor N(5)-glutamine methyltransferase n=1 Tax=Protofrankia sp. BMG5.30 TaxID=1834514 RepID=UPI000977C1D7|nr:peptide chain release factor N(5)-glutamine methyltransferase [Protofrankia sp. BMG5.30]ONH36118.1 protein-(glutamine-N5) methyltransferase, release factor-specific [Protofrankia sp. BMG5.30]
MTSAAAGPDRTGVRVRTPSAHSQHTPGWRPGAEPDPDLRVEIDSAAAVLSAAGVASPRADAEQLAAHVTGEPRWRLALAGAMTPAERDLLHGLVARRAARVPLQHLVGTVGFRYLTLTVGPGVFVPRPETETVVGWAIDTVRAAGWDRPVCVDLCTGSGAIALALADELPGARVYAVDSDPDALLWAKRNVVLTGRAIAVHHADVGIDLSGGAASRHGGTPGAAGVMAATEVLADLLGRVDLVVSNPPYLCDDERDTLEPEVGDHDPPAALWGGPDGLAGVRAVAAVAADLLRDGGRLVIEHADRHGSAAPALLRTHGRWDDVHDHQDLTGRDRFVTATCRPRGGPGLARGAAGAAGEER